MVTVLGAALGAAAIVAATLIEELTHLAAGRPWAVSQGVTWPECHAVQELRIDAPDRVDIWVSLAPFFVGLAALSLVILGRGVPPLSDETILFWVAWAWYTVPSLTDLKAAAGDSDPDVATLTDPKLRAVWSGLTIVSIGLLSLYGADELGGLVSLVAPGVAPIIETYAFRAGVWIPLAGVIWLFVRLELDTDHSPAR